MKITILKIFFVVFAYVISIFTAIWWSMIYKLFSASSLGGGFIGAPGSWEWIAGYPIGVVFILTFLLHAHDGKNKWYWNTLALIPVIVFEIGFDLPHIYIPVVISVIAWGLGVLVHKILSTLTLSFVKKIS